MEMDLNTLSLTHKHTHTDTISPSSFKSEKRNSWYVCEQQCGHIIQARNISQTASGLLCGRSVYQVISTQVLVAAAFTNSLHLYASYHKNLTTEVKKKRVCVRALGVSDKKWNVKRFIIFLICDEIMATTTTNLWTLVKKKEEKRLLQINFIRYVYYYHLFCD